MLYYPHFNSTWGRRLLSGLRLIESNRLEILSQALAVSLSEPLSSSLTPEVIVVQSHDMQRWLSMEKS
jgi:exonuclease V gamma subunit